MAECIFCKIASGQTETRVLYEDENIVAFKDLNPQAPFHALIMPKKHIEGPSSIEDEDANIIGKIMLIAKQVAKENDLEHYRIVANEGRQAGQSVFHLHFHLMGKRRFMWPPG
ncbi:MAG: HIT domain-containing protein [Elusimicrobiaceae bacterium]|jgi:histidine triad (HIT) family protein|nr:HIT domain-containing protein [Elusimicrobiaceae bacterium]MBT3954964.1 HIT domain-containing protein [Elusimicrobiaceae bacterium]MBT4008614.1 HIT domain-containing protein [Elusimicrobiaceae bacterium]MBT4402660.1 HIT domain-containing protein [Elusimicrobiaceae bacterium]MBT4439459.1 HIT domain-containing protein [Elusimicrobiaceae bacterium]